MKFGSVCSGIESASLAFKSLDIMPSWFSEIEKFPSSVLSFHYPTIKNHGDMNHLPELILNKKIEAPEILCGGTPCQAFSLAGLQNGLNDDRGQLTLKFIEIANSIDKIRKDNLQKQSIIMWENVEGVLKDKTNAFGYFIAGLGGLDEPIEVKKWTNAGVLYGKTRNVAWRLLDSKFFGVPQQRKRLYVIATDITINVESILFEECNNQKNFELKNLHKISLKNNTNYSLFSQTTISSQNLKNIQTINGHKIEIFRHYTDCLYSAYGTKWNGNAAAYNGSLYISQNDKIRRLTPLECERLMGFPDNYTNLPNAKDTSRYKAIGNSWNIQTIEWIANRIVNHNNLKKDNWLKNILPLQNANYKLYMFNNEILNLNNDIFINGSLSSNDIKLSNLFDIIDTNPSKNLYLSSQASNGIIRRKYEKKINMNQRLEILLKKQSINKDLIINE